MRSSEGSICQRYKKLGKRERSMPGMLTGTNLVLQRHVRRGGVGRQSRVALAVVEDDLGIIEMGHAVGQLHGVVEVADLIDQAEVQRLAGGEDASVERRAVLRIDLRPAAHARCS